MPYRRTASIAYLEHVGSYLHRRGIAGEITRWYTAIGATTTARPTRAGMDAET